MKISLEFCILVREHVQNDLRVACKTAEADGTMASFTVLETIAKDSNAYWMKILWDKFHRRVVIHVPSIIIHQIYSLYRSTK